MEPASVLGKRAGPIENADDSSMLGALQQLSASSKQNQPNPGTGLDGRANYAVFQAYQQQPINGSNPQMTCYSQGYSMPQSPLFPQSPPQDALSSPQSPVNDFGEKRRRVNNYAIHKPPQHHPQQPLTPQTPTSSGITRALPIPRQPMLNTLGQKSGSRGFTKPSMQQYPQQQQQQQLQHQQPQQHQHQQAAMNSAMSPTAGYVPGMPFVMDSVNKQPANNVPTKTVSQSHTQVQAEKPQFSGLAPALTPAMAPVPTTVVTKPPVVPSLAYPPRQRRQSQQVQSSTTPGHASVLQKPWKPQEITLPLVVDVNFGECDDSGGHYIVKAGEWFAGRYLIIKLLGQGTFGKVAQAWDERTRQYCAIKIIRAVPKYRDASKIELRVLSLLSSCDPGAQMRCVRMRECFDYRNHVCIVTDLYDISVYDFLKENQFLPFPGHHVSHFAEQILSSVAFIHSLGLVHTDLKPENVLLASSVSRQQPYKRKNSRTRRTLTRRELQCTDVTLIDFGSAIFDDEYHSSVVSTRHYRAPEIILGTGWSFPCDMWSIGCVLVELVTGRVLFETRNDLEHLHMMERTLGAKFSPSQLSRAAEVSNSGSALITSRPGPPKLAPLLEHAKAECVNSMQSIEQLILSASGGAGNDRHYWANFLDLITRLMALDPQQRISAQEALQHPWILQNSMA